MSDPYEEQGNSKNFFREFTVGSKHFSTFSSLAKNKPANWNDSTVLQRIFQVLFNFVDEETTHEYV